jgi:hypothetical protein
MRTAKGRLFRDRRIVPDHHEEPPHSVEMEVTVSATADVGHVHITEV